MRYRQQILSAAESLYASEISVAKVDSSLNGNGNGNGNGRGDEGDGGIGANGEKMGGVGIGAGLGRGGVVGGIGGERPVSPMSPSPAGGNGNGNEGGSHEGSIQALWRMMGEMELSQESKEKKMAIREKVSFVFLFPSSSSSSFSFFLSVAFPVSFNL